MRVDTGTWLLGRGWSPSADAMAPPSPEAGDRTLALVFADADSPDAAVAAAELRAALPGATVVGCSTAGQIMGDAVRTEPVVAAVLHFDSVHPVSAWTFLTDHATVEDAGRHLAEAMAASLSPGEPAAVLVLADGIDVNGTALLDGMRRALPAGVGVSGGLAGDGPRFERTWVYADGSIRERAVVAVALCGPRLQVGYGSSGGWDGFGPFRTVTASDGNVLRTLDGQPALALYRDYLGHRADQLPASALLFPLLIRSPDGEVELVRTVLGIDDAAQSMTFAGDIPQGWSARLMRTTLDRLIDAADIAAEDAARALPRPQFALAVSCVGRRLVLGQRADEEVEAAVATIGSAVPLVGFYSYGEISPATGMSELHNQTMTLTTLAESEEPGIAQP